MAKQVDLIELIRDFDSILVADSTSRTPDTTGRLKGFRERLLQFRDEAAAVKAESAASDPILGLDAMNKKHPTTAVTVSGTDDIAFWPFPLAAPSHKDESPAAGWIQQYREIISTHGPDSAQAANFLAARADVATFVGAADAIRRAHEGLAKYKAACEADARSDARSAFVGKVGRLAWGLVKFASIASVAGYVGRLAWADLAARYFG